MVQLRHDSHWDAFISHATEDKDEIARPLAERLQQLGLRVWFDEFSLTVGDSLRRSIDKGLAEPRFGIVIVSPAFLSKHWTQQELDGLTSREVDGLKVILPVWHNIDATTIRQQSPILADRLAVSSKAGVEKVTSELLRAIRGDSTVSQHDTISDRMPKQVKSASREPNSLEFSARFSQSFPGVRGIKWFESEAEIERRLSILLAEPLDYPAIWWWRDGNSQIDSFKHQGGKNFLMDVYELDIRRIAAVHNPSYYRQFVYVELNPMEPTGLYHFTLDRIANVSSASSDLSYFW